MDSTARLPRSVSGSVDPFIVCAAIIGSYAAFSRLAISDRMLAVLIVGVLVVAMILLELIRATRPKERYPFKDTLKHMAIAWVGVVVGFVLILLAWDTLAEYGRGYYKPFFDTLPYILAVAPFVSALFIIVSTRLLGPTRTGDYQLGLLALGRSHEVEWPLLRDAVIVWLIRGFFLPINFVEIVWSLGVFRGHEGALLRGPLGSVEFYLLLILYAIIVAAVTPGYLFSSRLISTETKAVSHSWFAWAVTLCCYAPFAAAFFSNWFDYNPVAPNPKWFTPWVAHLQAFPIMLAIVGAAILLLTLIHLWGEAQFGLRSSNMSNRGIITTGPYRFTKHPVYVAKCIAWLLIWMPFVSGLSLLDDVRLTILWLGVCAIYALRALAEEQLLASDPDYVAYATWIDEHGLFKWVGRLIPVFSFKWRLTYWRTHPLPGEVVAEAAH